MFPEIGLDGAKPNQEHVDSLLRHFDSHRFAPTAQRELTGAVVAVLRRGAIAEHRADVHDDGALAAMQQWQCLASQLNRCEEVGLKYLAGGCGISHFHFSHETDAGVVNENVEAA